MTSATPPSAQNQPQTAAQQTAPAIVSSSAASPPAGAVPAQLPVRSYANATKTATPTPPAQAGASAQNAASQPPVNGTMAQGGPQAASNSTNNTPAGMPNGEHGRKPSVVISATGTSGQIPNGGPVSANGNRPPINFGSLNAGGSPLPQASVPFQSQHSSLQQPARDPRVISPTHSPSPIPQPQASGGRPPSSLQSQPNGGPNFGSFGGESTDSMRPGQGPLTPSMPMHERRASSQSMQSDMSNPNLQNRNFVSQGRGRGGYPQQPYGATPTPPQTYRQPSFQGQGGRGTPSGVPPSFSAAPNSPYRGRNSPAPPHVQQHMQGGQPQMQQYGYPPHLGPGQPNMYMQGGYDPNQGYYQPYGYGYGYPGQGPPQSPRPHYPTPYGAHGTPSQGMQAPFHPPSMSRSTSQASERPASSMGNPATPSMQPPQPSGTPNAQPAQPAPSAFVRPAKKSSAIKITNEKGEAVSFNKPSPSPSTAAQPQTPVIVSTPNAPTPPPRAPSNQHNRVESKSSTLTAEERKAAFQAEVKKQMEDEKRRKQEEEDQGKKETDEAAAKAQKEKDDAQALQVKEAAAEAEKAAAKAAADKKAEEEANAAKQAAEKAEAEKAAQPTEEEEDEDARLEREIAEMEAKEKEEEEKERAYQEKKNKEKEANAAKEAERAAKADEELKRQEREAEAREEERERERAQGEKSVEPTEGAEGAEGAEPSDETDDEAKKMFASLKKPTLGPGASGADSGTETPQSEDSATMPPPPSAAAQARTAAAKPKPAHLKLQTAKDVEPAQPTPGMQALKSARFLQLQEEASYPDGFKSPNPALNQSGTKKARAYDKEFLLQFQPVFKEKPTVDWDQKVKDTLGADEPASARSGAPRTPSGRGPRAAAPGPAFQGGAMGSFMGGPMGSGRTLPPGTTSQDRFNMSQAGGRPAAGMPGPMGRMPSVGMGAPGVGMSRTNSMQTLQSPRQASSRGKGASKGGDRAKSRREEADAAAKMPLTAGADLKPLEKSQTGWKASSVSAGPMAVAAPDPSGNMAPDMVQRKVKAALNKMTPEKFDRISEQILEIAGQSKNESDGRTLRQVIALTFEKACDESHWAGMYAKFCHKMLTAMSPEIRDETIKDKNGNPVVGGALFRKYLLNRCQEEFERGWQVNLPEKPEGETQEAVLLSDEYYKASAAKRKGLGLIQFIGQLYKLGMLTLRIMHECVIRLLNFEGDPDEAAVENLTTLLRVVGPTMEDSEQGKGMVNAYFQRIEDVFLKSDALASRPRFMIMDLVDLRRVGWRGKDDSKGPKTLEEVHKEAEAAAAKREADAARAPRGGPGGRPMGGRGDNRNFSGHGHMQPPVDYARTNVAMDDLRKLQARGSQRGAGGGNLGPGGSLGPSTLGPRQGSRRGLGPGSNPSTRTSTPPVDAKDKKDEPASATNAFSALAALDGSGDGHEDAASTSEAVSPPAARNRSKSPLAAEKQEAS